MSDDPEPPAVSALDLLRWSEALAGIARTGLGFTTNTYEAERYEEVLAVAADIRASIAGAAHPQGATGQVNEWVSSVGKGIGGYATPKVAVGAVVDDGEGRLLLTKRPDSGFWLYPVGWADIGYSPSEVAVKEVREECGIDCEPVRLLAVLDGLRLGISFRPLYSLVFYCRATGENSAGTRWKRRRSGGSGRTTCPHRWRVGTCGVTQPQLRWPDRTGPPNTTRPANHCGGAR